MYLFLPRRPKGSSSATALSSFIKSLDQPHWSEWTSAMREQRGRIIMPRFELRYGGDIRSSLETLGLGIIFSPAADFSKIPVNSVPLAVSSFVHETYVKVDEEGTTAAAASAMNAVAGAFPHREPPPFELIVDHPFFCAIAETHTATVLFAGVINDPRR
jgi:serpin B